MNGIRFSAESVLYKKSDYYSLAGKSKDISAKVIPAQTVGWCYASSNCGGSYTRRTWKECCYDLKQGSWADTPKPYQFCQQCP